MDLRDPETGATFVGVFHSSLMPLLSLFDSCCQHHLIPSWRFEKRKGVSFCSTVASFSLRHDPQSSCSNRLRVRATKRRRRHRDATGDLRNTGFPAALYAVRTVVWVTVFMYLRGPSKGANESPAPGFPMCPSPRQGVLYQPNSCGLYSIARDPSPFPSLQVKRLSSENSRWNSLETCP